MDKNTFSKTTSNKPKDTKLKLKQTKNVIKSKKMSWRWPIKIFLITLILSLIFSISSELILSSTGIIISSLIIFVLLVTSVIFDMLGVAVAAASLEPFVAMSSKRIKGSKEAIMLVKNAEKVSSFASDVVGDMCGILSGAVGASIAFQLYNLTGDFKTILIAAFVSSLIAALTVFGKAVGKKFAINNPEKIVFMASKILSFFEIGKSKK